jgi:hypothetical protein
MGRKKMPETWLWMTSSPWSLHIKSWGFPKSWGYPNSWMVYFIDNPNPKYSKMDDLGVPLFQESSK